ncbi:MAG: CDP-diacylglycerol--glycerol-3-phosphate 3-phosphatidyltransferase [Lachnospiraceae bacterium]|jgi:CDP-diacylglycerol--glycerol-3-phosphate 3-phosphatidyltransferase|nr:CDP-diacylglycerol--glycerol-3-phosphate 3-phosphatidyltransferase [Lachnospiraceae bacterium]
MNLPNKLTVLRMVLVPFFVASLLISGTNEAMKWPALVLFVAASLTDFADGYIARKYNLITNFGKFMDPLADKILTISGMICLIELGRIPSWIVVIIVAREFIISGFRLIAAENGVVIAANYWGKFKTTFQMIMIILMIINLPQLKILTDIVMWIALALTIISLVTYINANKQILAGDK